MNIKNTTILLLLIVLVNSLGAQNQISSPKINLPADAKITGTAISGSSSAFVFHNKTSVSFYLLKDDMEIEAEVVTAMEGGSIHECTLLGMKDGFYVAVTQENTGSGERNVVLYKFNNKKLEKVSELDRQAKNGGATPVEYKVTASRNGEVLAVLAESPQKSGENESVTLKVYKGDYQNTYWEGTYSLDFPSRRKRYNIPYADSLGNVYLMKQHSESGGHEFHLFRFGKELKMPVKTKLNVPGYKISEASFQFNKAGQPVVTGFYSLIAFDLYEGYFFYRYNEALLPQVSTTDRLPEEIFTAVKYENTYKNKGLTNFYIQGNFAHQNGMICLLERQTSEVKKTKQGTEEKFFTGPVVAFHFDNNGNITRWWGVQKDNAMSDKYYSYSTLTPFNTSENFGFLYGNADKSLAPLESKLQNFSAGKSEVSVAEKPGTADSDMYPVGFECVTDVYSVLVLGNKGYTAVQLLKLY